MKKDLISVIIPVYNCEKYLDMCIRSVCNQTYENIEVIIVDDGSTDDSLRIARKYENEDRRVCVVTQPNYGVVKARKKGLEYASGKYTSIIDSDDWLEITMLEKLYNAITDNNVDVAMCGRFEENYDFSKAVLHGIKPGKYFGESLRKYVYPNMIVNNNCFFEWGIFPSLWDKLIETKKLKKHMSNISDHIPMGNDAICVYPVLMDVDSIYILDECLYHYRQVSTSMVRTVSKSNSFFYGMRDLYYEGKRLLLEYIEKYDASYEWEVYVLFLILPRIYSFYDILDSDDELFPFNQVKKGSRIGIYGMGIFGSFLLDFMRKTNFCDVVVAIDRNYEYLVNIGVKVIPVNQINKYDLDTVIITNSYEKSRKKMIDELALYVPKEKIKIPLLTKMLDKKIFKLRM